MLIVSPLLELLADRFAGERFVITRQGDPTPYLTRWTLLGRRFEGDNRVFLHRFHRSDLDELHDHPWPFVSLILAGGYHEVTPAAGWKNGDGPTRRRWYGPGRILRRPADWIHRVEIPEGRECWTLVCVGTKVRSWGFWCPRVGFRSLREHLAAARLTGGRGCD
jgi:hypothetical protein